MTDSNDYISFTRCDAPLDPPAKRVVAPERQDSDEAEATLRPKSFGEYVGQSEIKANLNVFIQSALKRKDTLDHVLLYGPPGLGKTTLGAIIAYELKVAIRVTSGPSIERAGDLAAILTNLQRGDVLFIDEIHRLSPVVEEILYSAMEDMELDIVTGKGPSARTLRIPLQPFTLIGATTKPGMLSAPLRDRFGVIFRLNLYSPEELRQIVRRSAAILKIALTDDAALEIASRSRGTPRIANRLLKRIRDFAEFANMSAVDKDTASDALARLGIDELGLDKIDANIVHAIIEKFSGGPVGLDTLSASTGEDPGTIEDLYEPYLIQLGFLSRTPRGRVCTPNAYRHFGYPYASRRGNQCFFDFDPAQDDE